MIIIILVLSGILLLGSAMGFFTELGDMFPLQVLQSYGGTVLIGLSISLAMMNIMWIRHMLYEYWIVIMIGSVIGAVYAAP